MSESKYKAKKKSNTNLGAENEDIVETSFKLMNTWEATSIPHNVTQEYRIKQLEAQSTLSEKPFGSNVCTEQVAMPFYEEFLVMFFWFLLFAVAMYGPIIVLITLYFNAKLGFMLICAGMAIANIPTPFVPSICYSYFASLNLKYFSFRAIWKHTCPPGCYIGVQPPHGLFPFGGILGLFAIPRCTAFFGHGVCATAILNVPLIGNFLRCIGCVDANRTTLRQCLANGQALGISSGGIAEIFETNSEDGQETIILRSRGGIVKLAIQSGVDIVPGYLFGNSKALTVWYDKAGIMQYISRKLRMSLVFFWGRFFLPIPYRAPLLAVFDEPIKVKQNDNPTKEEIEELLQLLEEKIVSLFDMHKASFGWADVKLIVK